MFHVESGVPCDTILNCWLHLYDVQLDCLVHESRAYERQYLAWETVRLVRNPFFRDGTGFEGYFVGLCHSPEEMQVKLLETGREVLACIGRMYPHEHAFRTRLLHSLENGFADAEAMGVWATMLGTELGKLRRNTDISASARDFQSETYRSVYQLPPIRYTESGCHIQQEYSLSPYWKESAPKPEMHLPATGPEEEDAALVVATLGRFGHPLIRAYLRAANPHWWRNG